MRRTPFSCSRSSRKSAVVCPMESLSSVLRCAARSAHRGAVAFDDLGRLGGAVLGCLQPAAGVALALERAGIALLLVRAVIFLLALPASEHGRRIPERAFRYTGAPRGPFV